MKQTLLGFCFSTHSDRYLSDTFLTKIVIVSWLNCIQQYLCIHLYHEIVTEPYYVPDTVTDIEE